MKTHLDTVSPEFATLDDLLRELRSIRAVLSQQSSELLTAKATAKLLGISVASLYRIAASDPRMRPVRVGTGSKRWRRTDLQKYISGL
jgi:predicted DNA-binding transcriptional regulator AlpA